jgi:hypothetical protein
VVRCRASVATTPRWRWWRARALPNHIPKNARVGSDNGGVARYAGISNYVSESNDSRC